MVFRYGEHRRQILQLWDLGSQAYGFNMKSMEADASSLRLARTQGAVLPCCACFREGVLRQSLFRETLRQAQGRQVSHTEPGLSSQDGLDSHISGHFQFGHKSDGSL